MPDEPIRSMTDLEKQIEQGKYTEVTTDAGTILYCRVVPPFAQTAVHRRMPAPPLPRVEVRSKSGDNVETHLALPGTPEHDAYIESKEQHRREFGLALQRFSVNYGIVAWRIAPGELPQIDPPEGWTIPNVLREYGVEDLDGPDHRAQYILYELLLSDNDVTRVDMVILPSMMVTKEDVAAAMAPFDSSMLESLSSMVAQRLLEKEQE